MQPLNKLVPDDVLTYGLLADASMAFGKYEQAEKAVQMMLDLRPEEPAGLLRAANLRDIYGDPEGAREMLEQVFNRTTNEPADRAALLARVGHFYILMAKPMAAKNMCRRSLAVSPACPDALWVLAEASIADHKDAEAVVFLRKLVVQAPSPQRLYGARGIA